MPSIRSDAVHCKVYNISDSVTLSHIKTDKFKKARLTLTFATDSDKNISPVTSMLMSVAFMGTRKYPDFRSICCRAEELYAADLSDLNIPCGGAHIAGIAASMLNDEYAATDDRDAGLSILDGTFELISEIILRPQISEEDTQTAKANFINRIRSRQNEAFGYAKYRFLCAMQGDAPGGYPLIGEVEQIENIDRKALCSHHEKVIKNSKFEFFYCGTADAERVISLINKYFAGLGGEYKLSPYEPKRIAEKAKYISESGAYMQGNLLVGFRTGTLLYDADYYATEVMNQIYGESASSKLFLNVREKRSLCYFCASSYDEERGILAVGCGIDNENYSEALDEILFQLDEMRRGNITDEEIAAAKESLESDCRAAEDHPSDYEDFGRVSRLYGGPQNIEEYRQGVLSVTRDEIADAAKKLTLDTVYFLKGELSEGGENDE